MLNASVLLSVTSQTRQLGISAFVTHNSSLQLIKRFYFQLIFFCSSYLKSTDTVFPASACMQCFLLRDAVGGSRCLSTFLTCHHMPVKHSTEVKILRMQKKEYWGEFVLEWIHGVQSTTHRKSLFCAFFCEGRWRGELTTLSFQYPYCFPCALAKPWERGAPCWVWVAYTNQPAVQTPHCWNAIAFRPALLLMQQTMGSC